MPCWTTLLLQLLMLQAHMSLHSKIIGGSLKSKPSLRTLLLSYQDLREISEHLHVSSLAQLSLHLQVAVHRKQLLKVKFGLEVKIFSQWFESIIQLNLCHRAEIRHRRSVESSRVILNLNICHLPSVQCLGDYFGGLLGPQVGWIQNSWIESYISDRSLTTLTWNTVHLASENYEL